MSFYVVIDFNNKPKVIISRNGLIWIIQKRVFCLKIDGNFVFVLLFMSTKIIIIIIEL